MNGTWKGFHPMGCTGKCRVPNQPPMVDLLLARRAKKRVQRRLFLKAMGLGLSAPIAAKLIHSANATSTGRPTRFLMYFVPHGMPYEHLLPNDPNAPLGFTDNGLSILGSLEPYKNLVNIYEGFRYADAATHESTTNFLSGGITDQLDDVTERTSLEHYIGNEMGVQTLALGAAAQKWGFDINSKVMWDGQAVVPQRSPLVAYDEVFGGLAAPGGAPAPAPTDNGLRDALLDLTERDIASLQSEVSKFTTENNKLQTHLESIQALRSTGSAQISCTSAPELAAVEALRAQAAGQPDDWFLNEENFPQILQAQLEVAAASMVCNARPVTAVQSLYTTSNISFGFVDAAAAQGHHDGLSHAFPQFMSGAPSMTAREGYAMAQRWFVEQLTTHVIEKLDVPDPADAEHTVLENTIILLCSEVGDGALHGTQTEDINASDWLNPYYSYLPLVTIGGGGGCLNTGQRLNYHDREGEVGASDRDATELWLTMAQAMGLSTTEFGGSTKNVAEALA